MPKRSVQNPFNTKPNKSIDSIGLTGLSESLVNGIMDISSEDVVTRRRLGLDVFKKLGTYKAINGTYWWEEKSMLIVVSDGYVYKILDELGTSVNITGDKLNENGKVTFATNGTTLVMANGGRMVYTDGTANTQYIADTDAPTSVTHVAFLDYWLIANVTNTGVFKFADFINAPTTWLSIDIAGAEANPDIILGLYVNKRILTLVGTHSIEFWMNDGVTPFSRLQGTTTAIGGMAPHSTVFANEVGYYWDSSRRFVRLQGSSPDILSTPYDRLIQSYSTVDDCVSDYIFIEGKHFVRFQFPSENKTLMYDLEGDYWTEWEYHDGLSGNKRFLGEYYTYCRKWNLHIFGSWRDDMLYKMTPSSHTDDGVDIHFQRVTGHNDYGNPGVDKVSYDMHFRMKTGEPKELSGQEKALLDWRDNGSKEYSKSRELYLKPSGDTSFTVSQHNLGSYESRQWRLRYNGAGPFSVGKVTERVEVLSNG